MKTFFTFLTIIFCLTTIQSQSLGDIFKDIENAQKEKSNLVAYINKMASGSSKTYYAEKTDKKASEIIRTLKSAHSKAIAYQKSLKGKEEYNEIRSELSKLQGTLYSSFSALKQMKNFTDRFINTSSQSIKSKNYNNISNNFNDFQTALKKSKNKLFDIVGKESALSIKRKYR